MLNHNLPTTNPQNGISYTLHGDYYLPDFALSTEKEDYSFGMFGRMRLQYLKNHRPIIYSKLLASCRLNRHLHEIDVQCTKMVEQIVEKLAKQNGVDEQLKAENQMLWVGYMNTFREQAREIINNEIINSQSRYIKFCSTINLVNFGLRREQIEAVLSYPNPTLYAVTWQK